MLCGREEYLFAVYAEGDLERVFFDEDRCYCGEYMQREYDFLVKVNGTLGVIFSTMLILSLVT